MTAADARAADRIPRQAILLTAWLILLCAACLALNTRHNGFPYFYHPDERGKVRQVMTGDWNFHHPMLLLASTELTANLLGTPQKEQAIVESGRLVSAVFMALSVAALSALAFVWRGWLAALGTGAALLLHHQLYELAHYMKEDSALLFGMASTFLTMMLFWQWPTHLRALALGVAVGLAVSGKYLGAVAILLALPVLWCRTREGRGVRFGIFFCALAVTFAIVNLGLLTDPQTFRESFGREVDFVVKGQRGMTRSVPHAQYWNVFIDNTTPAIWLLLAAFLVVCWRERRAFSLPQWIIIVFPFAYAVALSFSPKTNDRYFLPATAVLTMLAAIGAVDLGKLLQPGWRARWLPLGATLLLVLSQFPSWLRYEHGFLRDDNAELLAWIRTELPANAIIAKDGKIKLPVTGDAKGPQRGAPLPQTVLSERFAADLGSIEELRARGVTHVVISRSDSGKFRLGSIRPQAGEAEDFERRKKFYEQLERDGKLVFERDPRPARAGDPIGRRLREMVFPVKSVVQYLHPGIRVYRITPSA